MPRTTRLSEGGEGLPEQFKAKFETMLDVQRILGETVNADGTLKPEGWRALLHATGMEMSVIAEALGITTTCISQTISGRRRSRRIEEVLAELFHLDPDRVWAKR